MTNSLHGRLSELQEWFELGGFYYVDMKCIETYPVEKAKASSQRQSLQLQNTFLIQVNLLHYCRYCFNVL